MEDGQGDRVKPNAVIDICLVDSTRATQPVVVGVVSMSIFPTNRAWSQVLWGRNKLNLVYVVAMCFHMV